MIEQILPASVFAATLRLATPYLFAALGETFAQRSGVLNLGIDGIMLMGAFFAFYVTFATESVLLGIAAALIVGAIMGLAMAFISVTLKAEQGISGIGVYLFGLGMSELLFQQWIGTPKSVSGVSSLEIQGLSNIEFLGIGEIFFQQNLLVYVAFLAVPLCAFVLNRTTWGLMIRAVGQTPEAADAMGVNVARVRYATVIFGGMMAGLGGAALSIALLNTFQQNITSGIGFIAVALVYFGGWRPFGVLLGILIFSFVRAVQLQVGAIGVQIPDEFAAMLPYLITIIALVFASKRQEKPTALTKPFERGE
jgi:simple sugar transport system permease protein